MIYVSSACVRARRISESIRQLADQGFRNIELSGGTEAYDGLAADLVHLRDDYGLRYLCHNYFPPPKDHFVLNLASTDESVRQRTIAHVLSAVQLCSQLDVDAYSVHAGFLFDIPVTEVGGQITAPLSVEPEVALGRFYDSLQTVNAGLPEGFLLYLENNVLSRENLETYAGRNPFLMTRSAEIVEVVERTGARLLLDIGHLKVSAASLNLSLERELEALLPLCDYFHISDNDGLADTNQPLVVGSSLFSILRDRKELLQGDVFTIEVYGGLQDLKKTHSSVEALLHA